MRKDIIKSVFILLIIIGIYQLIGYLIFQFYDYRYKHEGINSSGLATIETALLFINAFCIFIFATPKKWLEDYKYVFVPPSFILSVAITFVMVIRMNNLLETTIKDALDDSCIVIGFVTNMEKHYMRNSVDYHIWTGINDSTKSCQYVKKQEYESLHIGDTVILQVSRQYPCINKVLKWTPTHEQIEKYK